MKTSNLVFSSLVAALALSACAKKPEETAVNLVPTSVVITSSAKAPGVAQFQPKSIFDLLISKAVAFMPATLQDSLGQPITINQAWVAVKSIKFKMAETVTVGEDDSIKFVGPYYVDLLSTSPTPIDTQSLPEGAYRRIEFQLHSNATVPAGVPSQMVNKSIYLAGSINSHLFTFTSSDGAEIRIAGPKGLPLDGVSDLLVSVRVSDILSKIDLSAITADVDISESNRLAATNPCPLIDATAADIYTCVRKGLDMKIHLGKDHDHSGEIEATEEEVHQTN